MKNLNFSEELPSVRREGFWVFEGKDVDLTQLGDKSLDWV
jgi:hypothetical protein